MTKTASSDECSPRNWYARAGEPLGSVAMSSYKRTTMPPTKMQTKSSWLPAAMLKSSLRLYGLQTSSTTRNVIETTRAASRRMKCSSTSSSRSQPTSVLR
eukprot:5489611-Prymnesium_polylepis.3